MRNVRFVWALLLVGVLVDAAFALPAAYTITDLGAYGTWPSTAYAINNSGVVVGEATTQDGGQYHAILWEGGQMIELSTEPRGFAWDIDDNGQIVGEANGNAILWKNRQPQFLEGSGKRMVVANNINKLGLISGAFKSGSLYKAATWNNGLLMQLSTLTADESIARCSNSSQKVVGTVTSGGHNYATLWSGGQTTRLVPSNMGVDSQAMGINASGQIVGWYTEFTGPQHAFIYENGQARSLGDGAYEAFSITDSGVVVGQMNDAGYWRAMVWENGVTHNLTNMLANKGNWSSLYVAQDLNDLGQIVGIGQLNNGTSHAFLLTPVPEPASLCLLAAGALAILRRRGKRSLSRMALPHPSGVCGDYPTTRAAWFPFPAAC